MRVHRRTLDLKCQFASHIDILKEIGDSTESPIYCFSFFFAGFSAFTAFTNFSTILQGKGAHIGAERPVLYCVINRSEVSQLKAILQEVNPKAFMVIGQAHEAVGEGFKPLVK